MDLPNSRGFVAEFARIPVHQRAAANRNSGEFRYESLQTASAPVVAPSGGEGRKRQAESGEQRWRKFPWRRRSSSGYNPGRNETRRKAMSNETCVQPKLGDLLARYLERQADAQ